MALVFPGEEVSLNSPGRRFERHHHLGAYAALIVRGACEEAGDSGRYSARAGDVLVHGAFEAHCDRIGAKGALIINFRLDRPLEGSFGCVSDVDALFRMNQRDPVAASDMLHSQYQPYPFREGDWPDLLAASLSRPQTRLDEWAENHGLNPCSLSRGFKLAYGTTPNRYRLEQMASRAAQELRSTTTPLSLVAAETGFADQAHMSRTILSLFGFTPRSLRRLS